VHARPDAKLTGAVAVEAIVTAAFGGSLAASAPYDRGYRWANMAARRIVALAQDDDRRRLVAVLGAVEGLLDDTTLTPDAQALLITGLLDPLHGMTTHPSASVHSSRFVDLFGPATLAQWQSMHSVWGGSDEIDLRLAARQERKRYGVVRPSAVA